MGVPRIGLDTARSDSCYRETSNRIPKERLSIFHIARDTSYSRSHRRCNPYHSARPPT